MALTHWQKLKNCSTTDSSRNKEKKFWIQTLKTRLLTEVLRQMSWWLTQAINFTTRPKRLQKLMRWKHAKKQLLSRNSLTAFFVKTKWKANLQKSRDISSERKFWSVWVKLKRRSERTVALIYLSTSRLMVNKLRLNTARPMVLETRCIC